MRPTTTAALAALIVFLSAAAAEGAGGIPKDTIPWQEPQYWPFELGSPHFVAHYRVPDERSMAEAVLGPLEYAWHAQVVQGGARAPRSDRGVAGADGRLDVYLWRGLDSLYVDGVEPYAPTAIVDDWSTFMVLDPWGKYGGPELTANIFHEFRHACQASYDWWEHIQFFEAEATLWETRYFGYDRLSEVWQDYQDRPDWGLFRDDGYRTWTMYGGALYLLFLSERYFGGGLDFSNDLWRRSENVASAELDPLRNEPDFCDALDTMLRARGASLESSILAFARARWYAGACYDGAIPDWQDVPAVASTLFERAPGARTTRAGVNPMITGTDYIEVARAPTDPDSLLVSLEDNAGGAARFVVQRVGAGAADGPLDLSRGPARVPFAANGRISLAVTALPPAGRSFDPETQTDTRMRAKVVLKDR